MNVFPSAEEDQRLVLALEREPSGSSRLVLRQESFSEDVGWFVQSRVSIEPDQLAGLKMSLTGSILKPHHRGPQRVPHASPIVRFAPAS